MNDELNHEVAAKTISLVFQTSKLTKDTFVKALNAFLDYDKRNKANKLQSKENKVEHGKMSIEKLVGQGQGASSIEVENKNIRSFQKIAEKYNVDFAVKKDKTGDAPKYYIFFKGKDTDVIAQAFREYVKTNENSKNKISLRKRLVQKIKQANQNKKRQRQKNRHLEQSR